MLCKYAQIAKSRCYKMNLNKKWLPIICIISCLLLETLAKTPFNQETNDELEEKKPSVKHSSKLHTNQSSKSKSTKVPELAERQAIYKAFCGNRQKHSTGKAACCATMREQAQNRNEDKLSIKNARKLADACKPYRKALFKLSKAYCNHTHKIYDKNGASGNGKSANDNSENSRKAKKRKNVDSNSSPAMGDALHKSKAAGSAQNNDENKKDKLGQLVDEGYEIKGFSQAHEANKPDDTFVWTLVKKV
uniref:Uncharacterized protein n=1 Tax=Globodera rostochiensis TaxID=31243 RepID=A0A914H6K1_GLORO